MIYLPTRALEQRVGPGIVRNPGQALVPELLTRALREMLTLKPFCVVCLFSDSDIHEWNPGTSSLDS